ncbi:MAG: RNAase P [Candidatus Aenigmarchaeota archaeon]|nr:RNAase P [Candidatus Aenigmarchaeota archaeon]
MPKKSRRSRNTKPIEQIKIAKERIAILISEAEKVNEEKLSKRHVELAKRIGMRYNVRLPKAAKRKFCKYCNTRLITGWRTKKGMRYNVCKSCGRTIRFPFRKRL